MTTLRTGRIYKIVTLNDPQIYIGSTFKTLEKRLQKHENHFREKSPITSVIILQFGDYKIELLEEVEVENKVQLRWRERFWYEQLKEEGFDIVNKLRPIVSEEERKEHQKEYRLERRDELLVYGKIYYEKEKESIKKRAIDWYAANKEKVKSRQDERITCDICQCSFRRGELAPHKRSLKHIRNLEL
jgi:hypothetical protein